MQTLLPPRARRAATASQAGVMLLEALIAILIFSVGLLGIVGLQAKAVTQNSEARYRSEAALLSNQLIASMRTQVSNLLPFTQNVAVLQAAFNNTTCSANVASTAYCSWMGQVSGNLPMGHNHPVTPPTVVIDSAGLATITIYWLSPADDTLKGTPVPHKYITVAQITPQQRNP